MGAIRDRHTELREQEIGAMQATQAVITRMANNSQNIKSLFLTLSVAVIAYFGANSARPSLGSMLGLGLIGVVFWIMDAKYLQLERKFRKHYNHIICGCKPNLDDWAMDIDQYKVDNLFKMMFKSFSLWIYPAVFIGIGLALYLPAL